MEKKRTAHAPNVDSTKESLQANYNTSNAAQRARILSWLRSESLTTLQAREHLDVMHPAGRIKELRRQGYDIITHWTTDSHGKANHLVAQYILLSEGQ